MLTDDLLAYYTYSDEVLFDESMGWMISAFPIHHVEKCYLYDVSFSTHILDNTLHILMDYTIEVVYGQVNGVQEIERISEKIQKYKMLTVNLKNYPLLMELEECQINFNHWIKDASYEAKIVEGNKIRLTVHATIEGTATRKPYLNLCVLENEDMQVKPRIWEDPAYLSKKLAEVRQHLDVAHEELSEKNYIIDGLIKVLREWER